MPAIECTAITEGPAFKTPRRMTATDAIVATANSENIVKEVSNNIVTQLR